MEAEITPEAKAQCQAVRRPITSALLKTPSSAANALDQTRRSNSQPCRSLGLQIRHRPEEKKKESQRLRKGTHQSANA